MSYRSLPLTPALLDYLRAHSVKENALMQSLRADTLAQFEAAPMQISPEQGQFFKVFLQSIQAKHVLEIGTFTGYSACCFAEVIPDDGTVVCCDTSILWTTLAKQYWESMGYSNKITLHLAPALKTLEALLNDGYENHFDFAFIDADKANYEAYYEYCMKLVRHGGVIAVDNVLWDGEVINANNTQENTATIRRLNQTIHADNRVSAAMIPIGDGLTIAYKI